MKEENNAELVELFFGPKGCMQQLAPSDSKIQFGRIVSFSLSEDKEMCWVIKDSNDMVGLNKRRLKSFIGMIDNLCGDMNHAD